MKKFLCILVMLIMVFCFASYASAEAEFVIRASLDNAPTEPGPIAFEHFKKVVEEKSNGRIEVQIFTAGALGGERDVLEGLQLGTVQICVPSCGILTNFVPSLSLFSLPFLFETREHMYAVLDSEIGMGFAKGLAEHGFVLLGYYDIGSRNILTTKKVINSLADLKGLKIRMMEIPAHIDAFKALGASPLPMAYAEVYTAMETGVIDGMEAANSNYYAKKFYEVAPNYAIVGWTRLVGPIVMSKLMYDKMPPDLQKLLSDTAKETAKIERELYEKACEETLVLLEKAGVNVTYPDVAPFREAVKVVYDKWADIIGGREKIDEVVNFVY